jgi:hypothetical protein
VNNYLWIATSDEIGTENDFEQAVNNHLWIATDLGVKHHRKDSSPVSGGE